MSDPVIERTGRLADGWFPQYRDPAELPAGIERVHEAARAAGRDPEEIGIECRVVVGGTGASDVSAAVELARRLEEAGATHIGVNTMGADFSSPQQHIDAIRAFAEEHGRA